MKTRQFKKITIAKQKAPAAAAGCAPGAGHDPSAPPC